MRQKEWKLGETGDGRKETMEAQWQPERGLQIVTGRRACVSGVLVRLQGLHLCGEKNWSLLHREKAQLSLKSFLGTEGGSRQGFSRPGTLPFS